MAAAPRRHLKGCSEGQHPSREPSALNAESPGTPAQHPSGRDAEALPPHSPSQPGCLPATHHTCGEELCPKATGAHPQQHLSKQGQLLPTGCTGTQGQRMEATFLHRKKQHPQEGQRLELECLNCDRNRPIFWIRLDKSGNLHFILSSTHSYPSTLKEGEKTSPNFEASWKGNSYQLVVKNFRAQDQGTYFCVNYINQVLHFSSGQPAFFPGQTLLHPPHSHPALLAVPSQSGPPPTLPMALLLCPSHLITGTAPPQRGSLPTSSTRGTGPAQTHSWPRSPAAPPHPISTSQG